MALKIVRHGAPARKAVNPIPPSPTGIGLQESGMQSLENHINRGGKVDPLRNRTISNGYKYDK